jgi:hypothetical protein
VHSRLNFARGSEPQGLKPLRFGWHSARLRFAAQRKKACPDVTDVVEFWPRLEIARSFVLNELERILFVRLFRLEIVWRRPNPSRKTLWASRLEMR